MKIHCPRCQGTFRVEGHTPGTDFDCPFCDASFAFGEKETVILTASPQTEVRVELESEGDDLDPSPQSDEAANTAFVADRRPSSRPLFDPEELTDFRPGDVVGGYRLEEIIGSGGMSVVFRAEQMSLDRKVAFKVLRKDLGEDPEFSRRFRQEARALAELSHPNIVSVIDQGTQDDQFYLVMEYIEGCSLRDRMSEGRLATREVLDLIPPLLDALEYAHGRGMIHRDIKPENILLDAHGKPRIADFGLVRMLGEVGLETRLTKTQAILGTLDYMSPEQREGRDHVDHRADLYSMGVVIYELLTGELPIARFPRPSEKSQVDPRIDAVVMKILEKDPDRRYQRASEVTQDLDRLGQRTGPPRSPASEDEDGIPETIGGRLLAMAMSFSTIFFSVVFFALLAGNKRNDEAQAFAVGVAFPFYLGQLVYYGLLPRPVVSRRNYFYRHPIIGFSLLLFVVLIAGEERLLPDEGTSFLTGLFLSTIVAILYWRKKLFRHSRHEESFVPWAGAPREYRHLRGEMPKRVAAFATESAERARRAIAASHDRRGPSNPPDPPAVETTEPAPRRRRFGIVPILVVLIVLPLSLFTAASLIFFAVLPGGPESLLSWLEFRDMRELLEGLWRQPLDRIQGVITIAAFAGIAAYAVPGILLMTRVPRFIKNREIPSGAYVFAALLWALCGFSQLVATAEAVQWSHRYTRSANPGHVDLARRHEALEATLVDAAKAHRSTERLALFHRAYLLSEIPGPTPDVREKLAEIALQPSFPINDRVASLILLKRLYGDGVFDEMGTSWRATFAQASSDHSMPSSLRRAFDHVLAPSGVRPRHY